MEINQNLLDLSFGNQIKEKRVLLIEDDPYWQQIVGRTMKTIDKNISLRCVRSVNHAEQVLYNNNNNFNLIIADHYLDGDATGLDLWRKFKKSNNDIPFLMISGLNNEDFLDLLSNDSEYPNYLQKQLLIRQLKSTIDKNFDLQNGKKKILRNEVFLKKAGLIISLTAAMMIPTILQNRIDPTFEVVSNRELESASMDDHDSDSDVTWNSRDRTTTWEDHVVGNDEADKGFDAKKIITDETRATLNRIVARAERYNKYMKNKNGNRD